MTASQRKAALRSTRKGEGGVLAKNCEAVSNSTVDHSNPLAYRGTLAGAGSPSPNKTKAWSPQVALPPGTASSIAALQFLPGGRRWSPRTHNQLRLQVPGIYQILIVSSVVGVADVGPSKQRRPSGPPRRREGVVLAKNFCEAASKSTVDQINSSAWTFGGAGSPNPKKTMAESPPVVFPPGAAYQ